MNNTLIAFFSRYGENPEGGTRKGNAGTIASLIADILKAPEYQISTVTGYPDDPAECSKVAKKELEEGMRPALRNPLPDTEGMKNLILVYPNWWGNLPTAVYSFLDGINTEGITVYPVCTHEDNGLAMTERILMKAYPEAEIRKGIAIRGTLVQSDPGKVESELEKYLTQSGLKA